MWSGNETTSFPALSCGQHTLGPTIAALNEYTADCSGWWKCDDHLLWEKAGGHPTSVRVAVKEETHHWHCLGWSKLLIKILYNLKLGNFQTVKDFADTWACTLVQAAVGTVFSQPITCIQGHAVTIFVDNLQNKVFTTPCSSVLSSVRKYPLCMEILHCQTPHNSLLMCVDYKC